MGEVESLLKPKRVRVPWSCTWEYRDREGILRKGKGKKFIVDGTTLELYPSGVLCAMLGRGRRTLYKWELKFNFPPAMYRILDEGRQNRWYSRNQLIAVRTIYGQFGKLKGENRKELPEFIKAVRKVFYIIDIPVERRET